MLIKFRIMQLVNAVADLMLVVVEVKVIEVVAEDQAHHRNTTLWVKNTHPVMPDSPVNTWILCV